MRAKTTKKVTKKVTKKATKKVVKKGGRTPLIREALYARVKPAEKRHLERKAKNEERTITEILRDLISADMAIENNNSNRK